MEIQISPDFSPSPQRPSGGRERGLFLSLVIVVGIIGSAISCGMNLLAGAAASGAAKNAGELDAHAAAVQAHASTTFHLLALLGLANAVFLTGAWMWKRWGVMGYACTMLFGAMVGMKASPSSSVASIVWGAML